MTTHELAKALLENEDCEVEVRDSEGYFLPIDRLEIVGYGVNHQLRIYAEETLG